MTGLPFDMDLMNALADQRSWALTAFFLFWSFLGEVEGYILVVTLIYVMIDKQLAIRLAVLVLLTMTVNHILKIIIKNPRPFIAEGTYVQKWAVSAENAKELATEFSTPSGHAMAGSAFYGYLGATARNPYVKSLAVIAILLTGLSRPYLGVHYLEDILIGWVIGISLTLLALGFADNIGALWARLSYRQQIAITLAASLALWLLTVAVNGWRLDGQPRAFLGYAGFLTGIVIAHPPESRIVNFDPKSSGIAAKVARYVCSVVLTMLTLEGLDRVFSAIADDFSIIGYGLQYTRYAVAGIVSILIAPLIFTRIGLAKPIATGASLDP